MSRRHWSTSADTTTADQRRDHPRPESRPVRGPRFARTLALFVVGPLTLAACGGGKAATSPTTTSARPGGGTEPGTARSADIAVSPRVVGHFDSPIVLLPRPGDSDLWLAERAGLVRRVSVAPDGTLKADGAPVLDLTDQTTTEVERGLLGLAFTPDGNTLFVSHTDTNGNSRVASYAIEANRVDAASRKVLLAVDQPYPNHNGGDIVWAPDGTLWLGLGDGGARDDPDNRAQNPADPLGKLLSINVKTGARRMVAMGLRNPWRFAFDTDGSVWIGDVGQDHIEEIDHVSAKAIEGANFGWSGYEGDQPYKDGAGRRPAHPVMPVFTYSHDGGRCSITGGFPYHGKAIAALDGAYLYADYCDGALHALAPATGRTGVVDVDLKVKVTSPISFGRDRAGEAYVLSQSGEVTRLDAR